jgi:ribosomal protein S18 acetylase RimI-like enzyme
LFDPSHQDCSTWQIREAVLTDIAALARLEQHSFSLDRISRRQFRYLLTKANAVVLVAEQHGQLLGNLVLLFSRASSAARLYSIAVREDRRGQGLGHCLIKAAETQSWARQRAYLRLEVRKDNQSAIRLYQSLGYRTLGEYQGYYQDQMDALRLEKSLAPDLHPKLFTLPYYEQSLDFTCGSAALMMAMKGLRPELELNRQLELRLWRAATTIFMNSGHGGCGPYGLALAAVRQGFKAEVYVSDQGVHLVESVRSEDKKEVIRLVQEDMHAELLALKVPIHLQGIDPAELEHCLSQGGIPLVLISSWLIYKTRQAHWVVVTGSDQHFIYVHDPFVDRDEGETPMDSMHMPIQKDKFHSMARYGRVGLRAMVVLYA